MKNVKLQNLRTEFETLKMKDSDTIDQFMNSVMTMVNQLRIHGEDLKDVTVVQKVLRSLTKRFGMVVVYIEESKDFSTYSIDELA